MPPVPYTQGAHAYRTRSTFGHFVVAFLVKTYRALALLFSETLALVLNVGASLCQLRLLSAQGSRPLLRFFHDMAIVEQHMYLYINEICRI